jgi:integrase
LLADGIDPLTARQSERASVLAANAKRLFFAEAAERWYEAMRPGWSNAKHVANVMDAFTRWAIPRIGKLDVGEIETEHVLRVLQQPVGDKTLWTARTVTADRLRNNIKLVLDWSAVAGHRPKDLPNPARWAGHLALVLPAPAAVAPVVKQPALPYQRVPELMAKLATREHSSAAAIRFLIMVACRINECVGARWSEIDLGEAVWTVPAARMKARKEWRQPLAPQAIKLLKALPTEEGNPFVFLGAEPGEGISDSALRMTLRREGYGDVVAHGFRSSFSTWAHERTAHSNHAIELSLAHSVGSDTEKAYRRGDMFDKRRRLMADWCNFVTSPAEQKAGEIVPIARARR